MRRGIFNVKVTFDQERIIDQKVNDVKQVGDIFEDIKKKFK